MRVATEQGKEFALKKLKERREKSKKEKRINNEDLHAGQPMFYYCHGCGLIADVLPETHMFPPKQLCIECQALKDLGWLE
jgi:hypothetical protein